MLDIKPILQAGADNAGVEPRLRHLPHPSDPNLTVPVSLVTTPNGGSEVRLAKDVLEALDARRPGPASREGTTQLTEVDSFIAYLKGWAVADRAVIYADTAALRLTAVLDEHPRGPTDTAWRKHRAVYSCPRAAEWTAWTSAADRPMTQTAFGDWIEMRLEDLRKGRTVDAEGKEVEIAGSPAPTDMLTVARKLIIKTEGTFQRDINPTTGDSILVNKHETKGGSTQIPRAFWICIPCFEGGEAYQIECRLRFALVDGQPMFSFTLHRAKEIERDAFGEVRVKVATETGMLVLAGTP